MSCSFNPRARMGRDLYGEGKYANKKVSTHAPAWGATKNTLGSTQAELLFQPTRPHGARLSGQVHRRRLRCFNPRARMGRDTAAPLFADVRLDVSTHAPAWGATCVLL